MVTEEEEVEEEKEATEVEVEEEEEKVVLEVQGKTTHKKEGELTLVSILVFNFFSATVLNC